MKQVPLFEPQCQPNVTGKLSPDCCQQLCWMLHLQFEARANTTLQKSVRKLCRQAMNSTEACTVSGNDDPRGKSGQGIAGLNKERFKVWPIEMEATKDSVDLVHPSQLLRIAHDIHNARMATSCHHHQTFILHMDHNCLIIKNKRIGHPGTSTKCLLTWHATLKRCRPIYFPGHKQRIVE